MNSIEYIVNNFIYHHIDSLNELVIQNDMGIIKIHNNEMKTFIINMDDRVNEVLIDVDFMEYFKENYKAAISFLEEYGIIQKKEKFNFDIRKITLFTNENKILKHIGNFLKEDLENRCEISIVDNLEDLNEIALDEETCLIVFLNPYRKDEATRIRDLVASRESYLLMTYIYNNHFYIDSLYKEKWKNPCHLCHIGHIESQLRSDDENQMSYQNLIDMLYHEDQKFGTKLCLTNGQVLNISSQIVNKVNKLITLTSGNVIFSEELLESTQFNLVENTKQQDISIHWELCDCYE
ncbi:McbB family protein [Falsibacillus pallidus]|uniref:McbB family protein n=1 Tax=Falsibacillus pallidus TaxID=493781 RepID=UPI003D97FA7E